MLSFKMSTIHCTNRLTCNYQQDILCIYILLTKVPYKTDKKGQQEVWRPQPRAAAAAVGIRHHPAILCQAAITPLFCTSRIYYLPLLVTQVLLVTLMARSTSTSPGSLCSAVECSFCEPPCCLLGGCGASTLAHQ